MLQSSSLFTPLIPLSFHLTFPILCPSLRYYSKQLHHHHHHHHEKEDEKIIKGWKPERKGKKVIFLSLITQETVFFHLWKRLNFHYWNQVPALKYLMNWSSFLAHFHGKLGQYSICNVSLLAMKKIILTSAQISFDNKLKKNSLWWFNMHLKMRRQWLLW